MPSDQSLPMARESAPKKLFRIGEVSQITGVNPHILRYWESEFQILAPNRRLSKQRLYRQADIDLILTIKRLLEVEKYTLSGVKQLYRRSEPAHGGEPAHSPVLGVGVSDSGSQPPPVQTAPLSPGRYRPDPYYQTPSGSEEVHSIGREALLGGAFCPSGRIRHPPPAEARPSPTASQPENILKLVRKELRAIRKILE